MTSSLQQVILPNSNLLSDGHASYPAVARNLQCQHRVVNHSIGFLSEDGVHTNNIECFWSHLKASMRKENGVKRINIDRWIDQYTFQRRYIVGSSREEFSTIFVEILKYYFE
jgi:hypothetical protein